ncbi:MAG: flagellar assembly protein A, partial [Candidatus Hinthialibacter sp.]
MNAPFDNRANRLKELLQDIDHELGNHKPSRARSCLEDSNKKIFSEPSKEINIAPGFSLYVNKNETEAVLKYIPSSPLQPPSIKANELLERIKKRGYHYGLLETNIQKAVSIIREKPQAEVTVVAAKGREPAPGKPPSVEYWIGNEMQKKASGRIQVDKNERIMRIAPSVPGVPGIRITGEEIEPPPVNQTQITAGDNVYQKKEGEFYAKCAGTVVLKDYVLSVFEQNRDAGATVAIRENGMQALISIEPPMGNGKPLTYDQAAALLQEAGVREGIQTKAIQRALHSANVKRQPVQNAVAAQGIYPTAGQDAHIEWHVHPNLQRERFVIHEDGSVDFYNQRHILTVTEGDHLLTVHPAAPGRRGVNVYGEPLPAQPGRPIEIKAGDHIQVQNEGAEWYAECTGLYRLHHNILEVQPLYYVKGDVDFSVGNIHFNGDVVIEGNILDGFEVRASGAISVMGTVEAATLHAGKCIEVKNGIFGKEKGRITAGENVVSFFLQNADVQASKDVIIGNQILNSRVYARRFVEVRCGKGSLIGGLTAAGHGIKARTIGSDYGTRTVLEAGADFSVFNRMTEIKEKEQRLRSKFDLLENVIEQERRQIEINTADPEESQLYTNALQRKKNIQSAIANLRAEYRSLIEKLYVTDNPQIIALDMIYAD